MLVSNESQLAGTHLGEHVRKTTSLGELEEEELASVLREIQKATFKPKETAKYIKLVNAEITTHKIQVTPTKTLKLSPPNFIVKFYTKFLLR